MDGAYAGADAGGVSRRVLCANSGSRIGKCATYSGDQEVVRDLRGRLGYQREKRSNAIFPERRRAQRKIAHIRLGAGGATLVMEGRSAGTAGPLRYIIVVWWDTDASLYWLLHLFQRYGKRLRNSRHGRLRWGQVRRRLRRSCRRQEAKVSRYFSRYYSKLAHAGFRVDQR